LPFRRRKRRQPAAALSANEFKHTAPICCLDFGARRVQFRGTTPQDKKELHRLTDMLRDIDTNLQKDSPLREGLKKSGLALSIAFINDLRPEIERHFAALELE
jgi:hypothetical protein